jgi:DNA invertase Pin-like site-specific DNA recombinase
MTRYASHTRVPSVGYLRRSSDSASQETSIPDQCKAIQKYADEKGYTILRWYTDDGISGDDTKRRTEFQRMIEEAHHQGDFKAILCWDRAHFGRFDSIEYGYAVRHGEGDPGEPGLYRGLRSLQE